jgi:Uma2 family endonuclease
MSRMAITTQLMTAAEFFDWAQRPENAGRRFELERGRAVPMSRAGEQHGFVAGNFARILGNYTFARKRGYVCANDTGVLWERDPDTVRGPDVLYYAERRRTQEMHPKYSERVPKLIVEVLSPNDRLGKVTKRMGEFLRWGVAVAWVADPEDRTLTVYRADRAPAVYQADETLTDEEALPGFAQLVGDFFAAPGEDEPGAG